MLTANYWLAAVPPCVGFAGWLFGGMDSKPLCVPGMGTYFFTKVKKYSETKKR